jgi:drug/metabolite transporter (DMT)-like permease
VFAAGVVGISFAAIFVRLALPAPPVVTGFYRMLFASGAVGVALALRRRSLALSPRLALWNTSIVKTSVATATLLVNTTPFHVGLWSSLVLRQPLDRRFVAGAALALAGAAVLLGISREDLAHLAGALLALAAAFFYSGYLLCMTAARREGDALPALGLSSAGATAALGIYALARGDAFAGLPAHSWAAIAGLALVSQLCGVLAIVWSLRYLPATVSSVALLAQPVGAALLAWLILGEGLGAWQAAGGAAVLAGIALAAQARALPGGGAPLTSRSDARATTDRNPAGRSTPSS